MKRLLLPVLITCCNHTMHAQSNASGKLPFTFSAVAAPEWTSLFDRTSGWFGGDGIFSIPLSGVDKINNEGNDSTLLLFSDTYIGEVHNKIPVNDIMVNNTVAIVKGNEPNVFNIRFYHATDATGKPASFFTPQTSTGQHPQLFWLGDGFVNKEKDNTLYIFGYKVERTGPGVFDFIEPGVSLIAIPKNARPPFSGQRQIETSLHINNQLGEGNMGAGILVNTAWSGAPAPDGYVYVYGCIGKDKNLIAARVKPTDFEKLSEWKYWNGSSWSSNKDDMKPITNAVSNELSITPVNGKYLLVFQVMGLSDKVGVRIGDSPVGPFSDIIEVWTTPEFKDGLWTYNAKAHPNLSKPGELLISYNTITADFWNDIKKDATIYHPRFIRLKITPQ